MCGSFFGGRAAGGKAARNRDKQHNMSNFFIDAAWAMFALLQPCFALIRSSINFSDICGEEYEIDYGCGGLRLRKDYCELPVGSQTYYMPNNGCPRDSFTQGIIIKVNYDRKSYDIQAASGLVDTDVPCNAVAFFVNPIVPFAPSVSLSNAVESRLTASYNLNQSSYIGGSNGSSEESSSMCNTAHLMRILTCVRKWASKWSVMEVFEHEKSLSMNMYVDLSILCGQLVWLLVVNIAHHSCCAPDDVYDGMGSQLDDVRDLIKKRGADLDFERADAFLADPDDNWDDIREWFERMYKRILYRSGADEWANAIENVEPTRVDVRPSLQSLSSVVSTPKTGGTGSLRRGAAFV